MKSNPQIIFEDDQLLVINKPPGWVVNRAESVRSPTVQEWAEENVHLSKFNTNLSPDFFKRSGIVHRLDKDTSGLLIIAKTPQAFQNLQQQFKNRTVKKTYLALAHGIITPKKGIIKAPVGRQTTNRKRFTVTPSGRPAMTDYEVLGYYSSSEVEKSGLPLAKSSTGSNNNLSPVIPSEPRLTRADEGSGNSSAKQALETRFLHFLRSVEMTNKVDQPSISSLNLQQNIFTLVKLHPHTGRTHQLRVHLKYINHPIVSDPLYLGRKTLKKDLSWCPRLFLHAQRIEFTHPQTGKSAKLTADLPPDLSQLT